MDDAVEVTVRRAPAPPAAPVSLLIAFLVAAAASLAGCQQAIRAGGGPGDPWPYPGWEEAP